MQKIQYNRRLGVMIPNNIEASYPCFSNVIDALSQAHARADAVESVFSVVDAGRKRFAVVPMVEAVKRQYVIFENVYPIGSNHAA